MPTQILKQFQQKIFLCCRPLPVTFWLVLSENCNFLYLLTFISLNSRSENRMLNQNNIFWLIVLFILSTRLPENVLTLKGENISWPLTTYYSLTIYLLIIFCYFCLAFITLVTELRLRKTKSSLWLKRACFQGTSDLNAILNFTEFLTLGITLVQSKPATVKTKCYCIFETDMLIVWKDLVLPYKRGKKHRQI